MVLKGLKIGGGYRAIEEDEEGRRECKEGDGVCSGLPAVEEEVVVVVAACGVVCYLRSLLVHRPVPVSLAVFVALD
ncbi:hypothetical protein E2C01_068537 [Portunus trituberculatus]|uniref:Uncharacterized protein n=1 Tax=Portunus trituberculatus TaxID=210409 RepID=A0A5B7HY52_PORTR|nr:hypothetical protein [Portunus trituberculatus]